MKSVRKDNFLYKNKMFMEGLSLFLTAVLVLFFTTSCNNLIQVQDKRGSLSIAVPSSRAASDASYTVELTDSNGDIQTKTVPGGQTVTFEELVPDTYAIVVKGENESGNVILYGTSSATVTAGESSSATVNLGSVVSTFVDLKAAVTEGGTVAVYNEIKVEETLIILQPVTIISAVKNSSLVHSIPVSDDGATLGSIFSITSGGKLTLGDGNNSLTVDGNGKPAHGVLVEGGELVMKDNVTIQNAGDSGVYISYGTFTMEGGTISDNTSDSYAGGVHIFEGATFDMKGGIITGNIGVNGNGVFVAGQFLMSGNAIVEDNDVKLSGDKIITVSGALTNTTVATITPSSYPTATSSVQVLQEKADSGVNLADVVGKFAVTPQKSDTSTINYAVDGEGKLCIPVTDEASLQAALDAGGTVKISQSISVTEGLTVDKNVTLVATSEGITLTNDTTTPSPLFTVDEGKLTLGDGKNNLTLNGNSKEAYGVLVSGGELVMNDKVTIQNAGDSGVRLEGGTFNMEGGTITKNAASTSSDGGGGVFVLFGAIFNMSGGIITDNSVTGTGKGAGVYVSDYNSGSYATFTMSGDAVVDSGNDVYLNGVATITVSGALTNTTVATITPSSYPTATSSVQVLQEKADSGVNLADVVGKFAVTPQKSDTGTINYAVDGEGKLCISVTDEASLRTALTTGGTVSVSGDISVTEGLKINNPVTLVASSTGATITNNSEAPLFEVSSGGSLTLGNGTSSLTLDGGQQEQYVVSISSGGTVTMNDKVTIQNAANSGVSVTGTFNMGGGKITGNTAKAFSGSSTSTGGGVYVHSSGIFNMTGGEITGNTADKGDEVYVSSLETTVGTFKMGGSATLKGGEVYLKNSMIISAPITLTSNLTSNDKPVAKITLEDLNYGVAQVLTDGSNGSLLSSEVSKFILTNDGTTINDSGVMEMVI